MNAKAIAGGAALLLTLSSAGCHSLRQAFQPAPTLSQRDRLIQQLNAGASHVPKVTIRATSRGYAVNGVAVAPSALKPMIEARVAQDPRTILILDCSRVDTPERFQYVLNLAEQANPGAVMIRQNPAPASQEKR